MVFVLDNYDSFTYNLVQYLGELGQKVEVRRNDQVTPAEVEAMRPDHIVVSPGPCTPQKAGISIDLIKHFAGKRPVLGVCLGHQAIGAAFGGNVVRAHQLMHGKTSRIQHDGKTLFQDRIIYGAAGSTDEDAILVRADDRFRFRDRAALQANPATTAQALQTAIDAVAWELAGFLWGEMTA